MPIHIAHPQSRFHMNIRVPGRPLHSSRQNSVSQKIGLALVIMSCLWVVALGLWFQRLRTWILILVINRIVNQVHISLKVPMIYQHHLGQTSWFIRWASVFSNHFSEGYIHTAFHCWYGFFISFCIFYDTPWMQSQKFRLISENTFAGCGAASTDMLPLISAGKL
jgi:hypothetical protein